MPYIINTTEYKWMTQYTHWQAQVLKADYHERGFGTRSSRNHSHVTNPDVDINHLCTQPSRTKQSLTNLQQRALLNHKPDGNNDLRVFINPCVSRDMIKSVHINEIDKLMFGLLYAGYLSERLQNTAFFFIDTAFFSITTFITHLTLMTFHSLALLLSYRRVDLIDVWFILYSTRLQPFFRTEVQAYIQHNNLFKYT